MRGNKNLGKFETAFWNILKRIGLFVAIPVLVGNLSSKYLKWNEVIVMIIIAVSLWIFYRESIILDLKNKRKKNGKK